MQKAILALGISCVLLGAGAYAQDPATDHTKADNTKVNKRDRNKGEPTADQQKEKSSDRNLAKNVRRAIVKDKSLSTYAHNVKVIVQNGTVTLKGPVHSADESKAVEAKAVEVAGASNVKNELSVMGDKDADRSKQ